MDLFCDFDLIINHLLSSIRKTFKEKLKHYFDIYSNSSQTVSEFTDNHCSSDTAMDLCVSYPHNNIWRMSSLIHDFPERPENNYKYL